MRSGSLVFQASSAACTFCLAVSSVKGGTGSRIWGWLIVCFPRLGGDPNRGVGRAALRDQPLEFMDVDVGAREARCSARLVAEAPEPLRPPPEDAQFVVEPPPDVKDVEFVHGSCPFVCGRSSALPARRQSLPLRRDCWRLPRVPRRRVWHGSSASRRRGREVASRRSEGVRARTLLRGPRRAGSSSCSDDCWLTCVAAVCGLSPWIALAMLAAALYRGRGCTGGRRSRARSAPSRVAETCRSVGR